SISSRHYSLNCLRSAESVLACFDVTASRAMRSAEGRRSRRSTPELPLRQRGLFGSKQAE
ncbi:MAG: hypothetical protein P4L82_08595, partial [Ancalomicrobiaceae bacterium]|nr:hypothetical protein [Ancalomicrobiaceae bacterium]